MENKLSAKGREVTEFVAWSKMNFGARMTEIEDMLYAMPSKLEQQVILVENMKKEIEQKSHDQFT